MSSSLAKAHSRKNRRRRQRIYVCGSLANTVKPRERSSRTRRESNATTFRVEYLRVSSILICFYIFTSSRHPEIMVALPRMDADESTHRRATKARRVSSLANCAARMCVKISVLAETCVFCVSFTCSAVLISFKTLNTRIQLFMNSKQENVSL